MTCNLKFKYCRLSTTSDYHRKENSMDQERRIKDLEDRVRSLNIMLALVSIALAFNALVNLKVSTSIWNSIDIICSRLNQLFRIFRNIDIEGTVFKCWTVF